MDAHAAVLNPLSKRIIGCALTVAGTLGNGFLEKVYENAPAHALRKAGLTAEQQRGVTVMYATGHRSAITSSICWWSTRSWSN